LLSQENWALFLEKANCSHKRHHQVIRADIERCARNIVAALKIKTIDLEEESQAKQSLHDGLADTSLACFGIS